jgi:hypothetical protein
MKCGVDMISGVVIYTLSFIKTGSGNHMSIGVGVTQIYRQHDDPISLLLFFF